MPELGVKNLMAKNQAITDRGAECRIERWIKNFSTKRIGSIFSGMTGDDHAGKLTKGQKDEIQKVLSKTPSALWIAERILECTAAGGLCVCAIWYGI